MTTQHNSPGNFFIAHRDIIATFALWVIFGIGAFMMSGNALVATLNTLSVAVGNIFALATIRRRSVTIRWNPLITFSGVFAGLVLDTLIDLGSPAIIAILVMVVLSIMTDSQSGSGGEKSRRAKDLGV